MTKWSRQLFDKVSVKENDYFIVDECNINVKILDDLYDQIKHANAHLLVIVCRADCFSVATSLQGLWSLEDTADWFKLQRMPELPICSNGTAPLTAFQEVQQCFT